MSTWTLEVRRANQIIHSSGHPSGDAAKTKACQMRKQWIGNQLLGYDTEMSFTIYGPDGRVWQKSSDTRGWRIKWEWVW